MENIPLILSCILPRIRTHRVMRNTLTLLFVILGVKIHVTSFRPKIVLLYSSLKNVWMHCSQPTVEKEKKNNKKHLENADTSTSVTFDLDMWPWPYFKVKKAYVIRCHLLYCTLVPGMMSVSVLVCDIWLLVHFCDLWPSSVTCIVCQDHFHFSHLMRWTIQISFSVVYKD